MRNELAKYSQHNIGDDGLHNGFESLMSIAKGPESSLQRLRTHPADSAVAQILTGDAEAVPNVILPHNSTAWMQNQM